MKPVAMRRLQYKNVKYKFSHWQTARDAIVASQAKRPDQNLDWQIAELDRKLSECAEGSLEATAGYYDDVFEASAGYHEPWQNSTYADIWNSIAGDMGRHGIRAILDLGCGPGQFALAVAELPPDVRYLGVDFSAVAIERAKALLPDFGFSELTLPVADYGRFAPFDCVVCTEVLEHVDADLAILEAIAPGILTIFSVPNFDSFGHVRVFDSAEEVRARYAHFFDNLEITAHAISKRNFLWVGIGKTV